MDCYVGIDLGSTTTKAVYMDHAGHILGRGITNSRSNYEVACQVAREEAEIDARFMLLRQKFEAFPSTGPMLKELMAWLTIRYSLSQHLRQLKALNEECQKLLAGWSRIEDVEKPIYREALQQIFDGLTAAAHKTFQPGHQTQSDFFRDIAGSLYQEHADRVVKERQISFDRLVGIYDRAIVQVESLSFACFHDEYLDAARRDTIAVPRFERFREEIARAVDETIAVRFNVLGTAGTGYGRLTLPFKKEEIRSEILCHGLGAHYMFPGTRTVLDIGGQDTKAIQVDGQGIVTHFQMNDRCAAGCGRYLGYIADEMNLGIHQLGPIAQKSKNPVKINSTCTVFAGAELRERLSLGQNQEDILAGLHRAIILRAMSLLARSGGVTSEFTFTGGVARNQAATGALKELIKENYGEMVINISPDSIYTGSIGACLFASRAKDARVS